MVCILSQARCVRVFLLQFVRRVERISQHSLAVARQMHRADSECDVAAGEAVTKQALKAFSTAMYLDSGAVIASVQEAVQHFVPILRYVALSDVPI